MKRTHCILLSFSLLVLLILILIYLPSIKDAQLGDIQAVWGRVRQAGAYHFTADILQTTTPLPSVTNVGRQSRQDALHVEGQADLPARTLNLTLWSQGGSLFNAADGTRIRVEDERAFAQQGGGDWQEIDDFTGLFAPEGDALAYLAAARDVVNQDSQTRLGVTFTRYTFRVDGRSFAALMRDQLERQLAEDGELPPGVELDLPRVYVNMTGQGELWVGEDGLPLRQILELQFPETQDDRVEARIDITFSEFGTGPLQTASIFDLRTLLSPRSLQQAGGFVFALGLLALILAFRRSKLVYITVALTVIASMVLSPLLESVQAAAFAARQVAQEQRLDESQRLQELEEKLHSAPTNPAIPIAAAIPRSGNLANGSQMDFRQSHLSGGPSGDMYYPGLQDTALDALQEDDDNDSDGDGLGDGQEMLLGTSPLLADTDGDFITDTLEMTGWVYNGLNTFYSNPLEEDTNRDGIGDWSEWYTNGDSSRPGDTDGDGVPDFVSRDNDGDGVPDDLDLSPFQSTKDDQVFNGEFPFSFIVDNLEPGRPTYVEFQLRPTNPEHLWYAFNVLDWPVDRQGQIQDGDGLTYRDVYTATASTSGSKTNENGDIKLLPMLEIYVPGEIDNLPPASTLHQLYGVFVQDMAEIGMGTGSLVYIPLQLVGDTLGGGRVAFNGKMLYEPAESWGEAQQVRLVWVVQALLDSCSANGWRDGQCFQYSQDDTNRPQIIQRYDDEWYLTGLKVREDHGQQSGVIWEDPAVDPDRNDDDTLTSLSQALERTFLAGRDCDTLSDETLCQGDGESDITVGELRRRLDHLTNSGVSDQERWNLSDILRVETASYSHQDEALLTLVLTTTSEILSDNFSPYWSQTDPITPTLMFVREEVFRTSNLDASNGAGGFSWGGEQGHELTVDMGVEGIRPITMASLSWKPYRYDPVVGWQNCPIEAFLAELENRYADVFAVGGDRAEGRGKLFLFQFYFLSAYQGVSEVIRIGDTLLGGAGSPELSSDLELAEDILAGVGDSVKSIVSNLDIGTTFYSDVFKELLSVDGLYRLSNKDMTPEVVKAIQDIDRLRMESGSGRLRSNAIWGKDAIPEHQLKSAKSGGLSLATVAGLYLTAVNIAFMLADYYTESEAVSIAANVSTYSVAIFGIAMGALDIVQTARAVHGLVQKGLSMKSVMFASSEVTGASRLASKIGLVISIGITLAFFTVGLVNGLQNGANNVQIQLLVAQAVAQIIMAVLMFALSMTVIGNIIVGIIIIFDTIMSLVGLEDYTTAALLAKFLYGYSLIAEPNCAMGDSTRTFTGPGKGIVGGNTLVLTQTFTATATMVNPDDWRAERYLSDLWSESNLRDSEVACQLDNQALELSAPGSMTWERVVNDHIYAGRNMLRAETNQIDTVTAQLVAGINFEPPIHLNMGYSVPVANCWVIPAALLVLFPICYETMIDDNSSSDLGKAMAIDVLPATLDAFYWWEELGVQRDHDGDGLLALAAMGNDPDDHTWDADSDGLSDTYEMGRSARAAENGGVRPSPGNNDTDGDGLCDGDEIRLGTFPSRRDTDGDGLSDGEEVYHFNCNGNVWEGGWDYTAPGETPVTIHVSSDPLRGDTDSDGINDKAEKTLGYNPNAWTPDRPMAVTAEISDLDGYVTPGQTFIYTATVENKLQQDPGLFIMGSITQTMPSVLLGDTQPTAFNLYQGEAINIPVSVAVPEDAGSQQTAIDSATFGRMHDGDLRDSYNWGNRTAIITRPNSVYGRITSLPQGSAMPFAVALTEGSSTVNLYNADLILSDPRSVRPDQGCGLGVGQQAPGLACTDDGECLTTWGNMSYHNTDNTLNLHRFLCRWQCDNPFFVCEDTSEFYINVDGVRVWYHGGVNSDADYTMDVSAVFGNQVGVEIYEDDTSNDDFVGSAIYSHCDVGYGWTLYTDCSCPVWPTDPWDPNVTRCTCYSGDDDGFIWLNRSIDPNRWDGIYARGMGGADEWESYIAISEGDETYRQRPAVASDGENYQVVWQERIPGGDGEVANWAIFAVSIYNETMVRLDAPGPGEDNTPSVAWAGFDRYAVTWGRSDSQDVQMAYVDAGGNYVEGSRRTLATSATGAQLAANPNTGKALVVYIQENQLVKGSLVDTRSDEVEAELTIGERGTDYAIGNPTVAYEPLYDAWLVGWTATERSGIPVVRYAALDAQGAPLQVKQGIGPDAIWSDLTAAVSTPGWSVASMACSNDTSSDYNKCDSLAISGNQISLTQFNLYKVPPWLGELENNLATVVNIDADPPTSTITSLVDGQSLAVSDSLVIGGKAHDPGTSASGIARVQISVNGGEWQDVEGAEEWVYVWQVPPGEGAVTLRTRATDLVGHGEQPPQEITIYLDSTAPVVNLDVEDIIPATQNATGQWLLSLAGTVDDQYSDVEKVEVLVSPNGNGWQPATLAGGAWQLDYALASFDDDGAPLADPTGLYTVQVSAMDAVDNQTGSPVERTIGVDTTPPLAELTYTGPSTTTITNTITLSGVITDTGEVAAGVSGLEVSFTPAGQAPEEWLPAALDSQGPGVSAATWSLQVPGNLEGMYQIDLRARDVLDNLSQSSASQSQWRGEIDTLAPRAAITATLQGAGQAAQTIYQGWAQDFNLTTQGFESPCPVQAAEAVYFDDPWWLETTGDTTRLYRLEPECIANGFQEQAPNLRVCDRHDHCTEITGVVSGEAAILASTVLTPTHGTVLDSLDPLDVYVGAFAANELNTITLSVNGLPLGLLTCAGLVTDTLCTTPWAPPGEGDFTFVSVATDSQDNIQSELQPVTITVDTQAPYIGMPTLVFTTTHRLSFRRVALSGLAADSAGLESVAVSVDGSDWEDASFDGEYWRYPWSMGPGEDEPDGEAHNLSVIASDAAGHTSQATWPITVDLVPPSLVTVTLSYDTGGGAQPLQVGQTVRSPSASLGIAWTESIDGSGPVEYLVGWSTQPTPDPAVLYSYPAAGSHTQEFTEPQALYAHLILEDAYGNRRSQSVGPIYLDGLDTPDLIADLDYHDWMESGCTQIGADREVARNADEGAYLSQVQRLYTSWDQDALRFTWIGADWSVDGDLFIYLDTRSGGATSAYNPYPQGPSIGLPPGMGADYLVWVEDEHTATLLTWSIYWVPIRDLVAEGASFQLDTGQSRTDLRIPFTWLGIANPAANGLQMIALASEEEALHLWATMLDKNPLNSQLVANVLALDYLDLDFDLTQRYQWASLGAGLCPNQGKFADADLQVSLKAEPPGLEVGFLEHDLPGLLMPGQPLDGGDMDGKPDISLPFDVQSVLLGQGQTITYTLTYTNLGALAAPNAAVNLTALGGLQLDGGNLQSIPLGGMSGSFHIFGTIDTTVDGQSAELDAVVVDATHGAFDWLWVQHGVDTAPPTGLEILAPTAYIKPGLNQATGIVSDPSGVPDVTLYVDDQPIACPDDSPMDGSWTCTWDAGAATDGTEITLRAGAADRFGNATPQLTDPLTVIVDATAPSVVLSEKTEQALLEDEWLVPGELWLTGWTEDERQARGVQICAAPPGGEDQYCDVFSANASGVPGTAYRSLTAEADAQIAGWYALAPVLGDGDGVTQTLSFYGVDSVGNRSTVPVTRTVKVDVVGPTIQAEQEIEHIRFSTIGTILTGSVQDGSGVQSLRVHIAAPDGSVRWEDLPIDAGTWQYSDQFDQAGLYTLGLEAQDLAGNLRQRGPFSLTVYKPDKKLFLPLVSKIFNVPPPNDCSERIVNGSFEESSGWWFQAGQVVPPVYSKLYAHSPEWSMQIGIPVGEGNKMAFTEIFQDVDIPSGASSATLSFWVYMTSKDSDAAAALAPESPGIVDVPATPEHDQQYAYILDTQGEVQKVLFKMYTNDTRAWVKLTFNLAAYIGEDIRLLFGTYNDGRGGRTGTTVMYVDDVSLKVCH